VVLLRRSKRSPPKSWAASAGVSSEDDAPQLAFALLPKLDMEEPSVLLLVDRLDLLLLLLLDDLMDDPISLNKDSVLLDFRGREVLDVSWLLLLLLPFLRESDRDSELP
jgi:hypothetical protein